MRVSFLLLIVFMCSSLQGARIADAFQAHSWFSHKELLSHARHEPVGERAFLQAHYAPPVWHSLAPASSTIDWSWRLPLSLDEQQQSLHFLLDAVDVIDSTGSLGISLFVASHDQVEAQAFALRIDIEQTNERAWITVRSGEGAVLEGPFNLPSFASGAGLSRKPFLPWRDGMRQFYSLIAKEYEGKTNLLLVQHTQEEVAPYTEPVAGMLKRYSAHTRLAGRPGAYLEMPQHMRCLPIPLAHGVYPSLAAGPLQVTMAVLKGSIDILPA